MLQYSGRHSSTLKHNNDHCLSADRLPNVYIMNVPWFREDSFTTVRWVMSPYVSFSGRFTYRVHCSVICPPVCHQWLRSQGCSIQVVQTTAQMSSFSSTLPPTANIRYYYVSTTPQLLGRVTTSDFLYMLMIIRDNCGFFLSSIRRLNCERNKWFSVLMSSDFYLRCR